MPSRPASRVPVTVVLAASWLAVCLAAALFADWLAPVEPTAIDLRNRLAPPVFAGGTVDHWLGTDDIGRDMFSRLLHALRVSIAVALAGSVIGAVVGTTLGFVAAHLRGVADDAVMLGVDVQAALPFMMVALMFMALFGTSLALFVCIVGLYGWERYARLARGAALSLHARGFVLAARAYNASPARIHARHILPNAASVLVVNATLSFPDLILLESALSFLGLGIQPPTPSLGNMLGHGRAYLNSAWWMAVMPGLAIVLTALSVGILGGRLQQRLGLRRTGR